MFIYRKCYNLPKACDPTSGDSAHIETVQNSGLNEGNNFLVNTELQQISEQMPS